MIRAELQELINIFPSLLGVSVVRQIMNIINNNQGQIIKCVGANYSN